MISGQRLCLEGRLIGIAGWVLTTALSARFTAIFLFAIGGFAMADQVSAAAVVTENDLGNHNWDYTTNILY